MPLSIFRLLGLGESSPNYSHTPVSRQVTKASKRGGGGGGGGGLLVIEDVLVKVDKFIFPADFIVLDMDEDK